VSGRCTGDKYALVMKFIDHVFDDQVIDHLTVKIILPEGSTCVIYYFNTHTHTHTHTWDYPCELVPER